MSDLCWAGSGSQRRCQDPRPRDQIRKCATQLATGKEVPVRLAVSSAYAGFTMLVYNPGGMHRRRCIPIVVYDLWAQRPSRRRTPMASTRTAGQPTTTDSRHTATADRLSADELHNLDAYWRACNYLAAGMIYLRANPLLREPLQARAREAAPAGALGLESRLELRLHSPQPPDQQVRSGRHLPGRPWPRRAGRAGAGLSGGHLLGGLSE